VHVFAADSERAVDAELPGEPEAQADQHLGEREVADLMLPPLRIDGEVLHRQEALAVLLPQEAYERGGEAALQEALIGRRMGAQVVNGVRVEPDDLVCMVQDADAGLAEEFVGAELDVGMDPTKDARPGPVPEVVDEIEEPEPLLVLWWLARNDGVLELRPSLVVHASDLRSACRLKRREFAPSA
jgi:hypothetical protein